MESLLFSFLSLRRAQGTELDFVPLFLKTEKLPMGGWRAVGSHARGQSRGPPYPWQGRGEGGSYSARSAGEGSTSAPPCDHQRGGGSPCLVFQQTGGAGTSAGGQRRLPGKRKIERNRNACALPTREGRRAFCLRLLGPPGGALCPAGPCILGTHKSGRWPASCLQNPESMTHREERFPWPSRAHCMRRTLIKVTTPATFHLCTPLLLRRCWCRPTSWSP